MRSVQAVAVAVAVPVARAAGGFYDQCGQPAWSLGHRGQRSMVVSPCAVGNGTVITSALNLNDCLANAEGVLQAVKFGRAFNSCIDCMASASSSSISCACLTTGRQQVTADFDLNTVVESKDGVLQCFGLPGFEI